MGVLFSRLWNLRALGRRGIQPLPSNSTSRSSSNDSLRTNSTRDSILSNNNVRERNGVSSATCHPDFFFNDLQNNSKPTQSCAIQRLNQDLLLKIFSFLDVVSLCRCAQVSKLWHDMAVHGSNWKSVDLFEFQVDIEGTVVAALSEKCRGFLRKLSLRHCHNVEDAALKTFAKNCKLINSLILSNCYKITDRTAHSLSQHCPSLRYLDLSSCKLITDATCRHLSTGCLELEHLDLSYCSVSKTGLSQLTSKCTRLKHLILKYCEEVDNQAVSVIGNNCSELVTLNLNGCKTLTDDGLRSVCENCRKLESLSVSCCEDLTDAMLRKLGACCSELRLLEAVGCSHFTDAGFQALSNGCNKLQHMDLEECVLITDNTLSHLSLHCPNIQKLALSHCERITDTGIRHLVSAACSETLLVLELDNCPFITDHTLDMLKNCEHLKRLEIFDCQMVSRSAIHKLERSRTDMKVHAFFPPHTPPPHTAHHRRTICHCCTLL